MKPAVAALLMACGSGAAYGQAALPEVTFQFERPATTQTPYTFHLHPDGTGTYEAEVPGLPNQPAAHVRVPLAVSPDAAQKVFAEARSLHFFARPCASKAKGIADTGSKTLAYTGPDGAGSCTYNYSESKIVDALTTTFQGMEVTLEEGRKLTFFHRYDRLSLGAEMTYLFEAAQSGRALEMGNIAGELKALADDTEVLERVRSRAATLLAVAVASGARTQT